MNIPDQDGFLALDADEPSFIEDIFQTGGKPIPQSTVPMFPSNNFAYNPNIDLHRVPQSNQTSYPLPPGHTPLTINPQNLLISPPSLGRRPNSNSVTSSSSLGTGDFTTPSSTSASFRAPHISHDHSNSKPHRLESSHRSSKSSDNPIKKQKLNSKKNGDKAARVLDQLKSEHPKLSKHFFAHLRILLDKETEDGNLNAGIDEMSVASSTQKTSLTSEVSDSGYPTETGTWLSSIPQAETYDAREDVAMDCEPEEPIRYCCTFPGCSVSQKDCKYQHNRNCQCPSNRGIYWSNNRADWKRHEEKDDHWPHNTYVCLQCFVTTDLYGGCTCSFCSMALPDDPTMHYSQCKPAKENTKRFTRKDHLLNHLQTQHGLTDMGKTAKTWKIPSSSSWPIECGFCGYFFTSWDERAAHVASDFEKGFKIQDWKLPFCGSKDRKPLTSFYPKYRKDDDDGDDADDDGSGGNGGNMYGEPFHGGYAASASQQSQQGQSSSSPGCGPYYQQSHYQRGYRVAHFYANGSRCDGAECEPTDIPGHIKLNIALERYLKSREEGVPAFGAAPWVLYQERLDSPARGQPKQSVALPWDIFMLPGDEGGDELRKGIISMQTLPVCGETYLVRSYISQHWQDLDGGVFWVNSKVRSEVRDSFWDIAIKAFSQHSMQHVIVMRLFNSWWQAIPHTLYGPCLPTASLRPPTAIMGQRFLAKATRRRTRIIELIRYMGASKHGHLIKQARRSSPRNSERLQRRTTFQRKPKDTLPKSICAFNSAG